MLDTIQMLRDSAENALDWVPGTVIGVMLLALAVAAALTVHNSVLRVMRRLLKPRVPHLAARMSSARTVTRFALVIVALTLVLPIAPLSTDAAAIIGRALLLATIILIGWIALTLVNLAADLYLLRFRLDTEDNLLARKHVTQVRILRRATQTLVVIITAGFALMTFDAVRQYGVSLFASAGVAGLVVGLAARPLLSNIIAGVQIAMTQPIRIDDAVVVEGEWGWIEEITSTYVVIKLWDWRRLIVPLSHFIEKPFQNWTREGSAVIGSVLIHADYTVPVARVREKLDEVVNASKLWDRGVVNLQVTDASDRTVELRALVSARNSSIAWDLRCEVREKLIAFLQEEYPQALPRQRQEAIPRREEDDARDRINSPELAPPG